MSSLNPVKRLEVWEVESMRVTSFPSPGSQIDASGWWERLVGEQPETRQTHPRRGGYQEEGPFLEYVLTLSVQLARIDWLLTPKVEEVSGFRTMGCLPEVLDSFVPTILRWFDFESCPPAQRLAFGAVLLQPVETGEAGYRKLAEYLKYVKVDPTRSSDLSYQINRPRRSVSHVENLTINRLSKWSVALIKKLEMVGDAAPSVVAQSSACRLELDINTAHDFRGELSREQQSEVMEELIDLGKEIAEKGDIP